MNESGLFSVLKGLNLNKILGAASKTLNFVNKAIPMYKEIKPTFSNLKKMLNIYSAVNESDKESDEIKESRPIKLNKKIDSKSNTNERSINDTLTFFQ